MKTSKILIVEDEKVLSSALSIKFENEGFETKVVESGDLVLPIVETWKPSIILLDLLMPKKSGKEVLEELQTDPEHKSIPVVILSNLDSDDDIKTCLAMGAVDYFIKTNHPIKEIIEKVKNIALKPK
jgi:DNA-binding response OmpR family regulator